MVDKTRQTPQTEVDKMSKTPTQDVSAIPIAWTSSVGWRANQLMSAEQYRQCLPKNRADFDVPLYGPDALVNAAAAERERLAQLFDMPATMHGEAEDWCREVAARIRRA